ncbi:MAG: hypothetical protein D6722_13640 [Bacteroidetes bacterium]|nr:MAG: hypothetical protein D6722_13640 [Bacteroidota bacterium]
MGERYILFVSVMLQTGRSSLLLLFALGMATLWGQPAGTQSVPYHSQWYSQHPGYRLASDEAEAEVYRYMLDQADSPGETRSDLLVIPVVVHIMHLPEDSVPAPRSSNLPDAQIQAGLDWLNDALRNRGPYAGGPFHTNAGIPSTDLEIEFCLAQTDPNGNPTNGIVRMPTPLSNLVREDPCPGDPNEAQDHCLRAASFWDSHRYMNIWLVNNICDESGGQCDMDGYSLMVGSHGQLYDGPVLKSGLWGTNPADQARLMRHVGHYLNLFDTYFQPLGPSSACLNNSCLMEGDRVCDTPPDAGPGVADCNSASPTLNSCTSDMQDTSAINPFRYRDVQDIYENFMDGGDGSCKNTFTPMQKMRVRWALENPRRSLLESGACVPIRTNIALNPLENGASLRCDARTAPQFYAKNMGNVPVTSFTVRYAFNHGFASLQTWNGNLVSGDSVLVSLPEEQLVPGAHLLQAALTDVNGEGPDDEGRDDHLMQSYFWLPSPVVVDSASHCVDMEAGSLPDGWQLGDPDRALGLDITSYARCPDRGSKVLRYNTSGLWDNGNGPAIAEDGTRDYLISPVFDLRVYTEAELSFDLAYMAAVTGRDLILRVYLGQSCNRGLIPIYEKRRNALQTTAGPADTTLSGWEPGGCDDWRTEILNLDAYTGGEVFFIFELEIEDGYSQNLYLDNICLQAGGACTIPTHIPTQPGLYTADNMCTDPEGWTHFWKSADMAPQTESALLLFSLRDPSGEVVLAPAEVQMRLTAEFGRGGHDLTTTAPYVCNPKGWYVSGRSLYVAPQAQPGDSILVRFYFDETDVMDMVAAVPEGAPSAEDLVLFRLQAGLNPDPATGHTGIEADWFHELRHDSLPGPYSWQSEPRPFGYAATLSVPELGGLGLGSGGAGLRMGATYPVPITLAARQDLAQVRLNWECAREWGTEAYDIFRAGVDQNFSLIGTVPAAGRADDSLSYAFADSAPLPGTNYYKVVLRHRQPWDVTSDTAAVAYDPIRVVGVHPNPSRDWLRVRVQVEEPEEVYFGLFTGGRQEMLRDRWVQEGDAVHPVQIEALPPGIYFYNVTYSGGSYWGKLVKTDW